MRRSFPAEHQRKAGAASAYKRRQAAIERDLPLIRAAGEGSLAERCERLNAAGYRTVGGNPFTPDIMSRMIKRASSRS